MGAYNCAHCLKTAVTSIINQDFKDWELIICNDGSKDKTSDILNILKKEDDRIILIENGTNRGLAYSLNQCLKIAKGEYIARMDADDISMPERLSMQVEFLDAHPEYDVVGSAVTLFNNDGVLKTIKNPEIPNVKMMHRGVPFFHPTIMMRKTVYDQLGGYTDLPRTRRGQDLDLWFRFFASGRKGYNLKQPLLKYHDNVSDYKKKNSLKLALNLSRTLACGFRLNHFPILYYIFLLRPVTAALLPDQLFYILHKNLNKSNV